MTTCIAVYIERATYCQASDVAVIGVPSDRQGEVKIMLNPGSIIDVLKPLTNLLTNTQSYLLLIPIFSSSNTHLEYSHDLDSFL